MKTILITGSQGFIGSYLCAEFLDQGYKVIGVDNFSKYGPVTRPHDSHPNFRLLEMDVVDFDVDNLIDEFKTVEFIIAGAAMIGGISYFHKYAYDLLATNERIAAATFDLALKLRKDYKLKRIIALSSSMVFENTDIYPTPEEEVSRCAPPLSTYGFQKLAIEYFCKGAYEQYGLPYTIIRPFNCVGVGEEDAIGDHEVKSGNVKLMMSHVLPDIINKITKGQNPLHLLGDGQQVRCYTNGRDIARGVRMCLESEQAINEDFNISTPVATTVLELAKLVWGVLSPDRVFAWVSEDPYVYDVQRRIPNTEKAERVLGFKAQVSLEESVTEVIEWFTNQKEEEI